MPPEYRCRWCDEFSPRIQGDEIELDDPNLDVVDMLCLAPYRWPLIRCFRRGYNIYPARPKPTRSRPAPRCGVYAISQTHLEAYNRQRQQ